VRRALHAAAALLTAAGAVALPACGVSTGAGSAAGTLNEYVVSEFKGFDPTQSGEQMTTTLVINYYDQLYEFDYLKRPFALRPCLAEAMPEVSADGLTYTIRLRRGIRFADDPCFPGGKGREFTAHDVRFSFLRLMDTQTDSKGSWIFSDMVEGVDAFREHSKRPVRNARRSAYTAAEGYPEVSGFRAVDDHRLEIRLLKRYPQIVWVLAMGFASVYPPESVAKYGEEFGNHPVSTGPYLVKEYKPEQRAVLVRNPNYRTDDLYPSEGSPGDEDKPWRLGDAGRPMPLNEQVVVTVMKETQPMWLSFLGGALDRAVVPKDNFDAAVNPFTRELRPELAVKGMRLEKDPRLEVIYQCFNTQDPVVGRGDKGRAVRRAISLAIDLPWATHHLYNDRVARVDGPLIEEFPEFDPEFVSEWKQRPKESRESALARAKAELARAGVDVATLPPIYEEVQDTSLDRTHFLAAQRDLRDVGIRLESRGVTWQEMQDRIDRGQAQTWGISWGADYPDAQNFLQLFYGPNKPPGPNGANYQNPKYDDLYQQSMTLEAGPERTRLYREMQKIVTDDCVWVFKYRRTQYSFSHPWLTGYRYNDLSPRTFKYCRVDKTSGAFSAGRRREVHWTPVLVFVGATLALGAAMVVGARQTSRGW
jgi:ABC-type transport system substrate-binding protein